MKKIHVLIGLPGSGKSYFAREYCSNKCSIIDTDKIIYEDDSFINFSKNPFDRITDGLCGGYWVSRNDIRNKDLIIDGLFIDENAIINIISSVGDALVYVNQKAKIPSKKIFVEVVLHYWNEDRENCSFNDRYGRVGFEREMSSEVSINNLSYIDLSDSVIYNKLIESILKTQNDDVFKIESIKVQKHEVYQMDANMKEVKKLSYGLKNPCVDNNNILRSASWCTGGAYGNCWDSTLSPVSGDEPKEFDEFDEIMGRLVPEVSFIKYKNIRNKCVKLESTYEHDYYGGGCGYEYWTCDLNKLVQLCKEYGYTILN